MIVYRLRHCKSGKFWKGSGGNKNLTIKPKIFTRLPQPEDFGSFPSYEGKICNSKDFVVEECRIFINSERRWDKV